METEFREMIAAWPYNVQTAESAPWALSLLLRRLKLPKGASLHSLRHTHGSHLLASGVPLPAVSARLGHGSIRRRRRFTRT
jgi:integrase